MAHGDRARRCCDRPTPWFVTLVLFAGGCRVRAVRAGASPLPAGAARLTLLPWLPLPFPRPFCCGPARWRSRCGWSCSPRCCPPFAGTSAASRSTTPGGTRGPAGAARLRRRGVGRGAVASRRGRAALPDHHAEPAARSRPQDREQPHARRLPPRTSPAICRSPITCGVAATVRSTRSTRRVCRRWSRQRS